MKNRKIIILYCFFALTVTFLLFPTKAYAEVSINLPPGENIHIGGMELIDSNDCIAWEFTSSDSEVTAVILNNYQYGIFDHVYNSPHTALVSNRKMADKGWWKPPHADYWRFLLENVGDDTTVLVITAGLDHNYFIETFIHPFELLNRISWFLHSNWNWYYYIVYTTFQRKRS